MEKGLPELENISNEDLPNLLEQFYFKIKCKDKRCDNDWSNLLHQQDENVEDMTLIVKAITKYDHEVHQRCPVQVL